MWNALLAVAVLALAGEAGAEERFGDLGERVATIPVGSARGAVAYSQRTPEQEWTGPESFAVAVSGHIFILDTVAGEIEVYDPKGTPAETLRLPTGRWFWDVELGRKGEVYALSDGLVVDAASGATVLEVPPSELRRVAGLFKTEEGSAALRLLDGQEVLLEDGRGRRREGRRTRREGRIMTITGAPPIHIEYVGEPVGTYPMQRDPQGRTLVLENDAILGRRMHVETRVERFLEGRRIETALAIPARGTYGPRVPHQIVHAAEDGHVYQMVSGDDEVRIYRLFWSEKRKATLPSRGVPGVEASPTPDPCAQKPPAVTCAFGTEKAHARGGEAVDHKWTFYKKNLTARQPPTAPPDHLVPAADATGQVGIAYCWGGMDGIDTTSPGASWASFDTGLQKAGNTAGNVDTSAAGRTSTTVGLDCSGFVCSAYKCSEKLSTRHLAHPSGPFKETTWAALTPGDIANRCGRHVWMLDEVVREGGEIKRYHTFEATADTFDDKARRGRREAHQVQDYVPMTLK